MKFPPLRLREALSLGGLTPREAAVRTWNRMNDHEIMTRAAAVSFYAMLALVPSLALFLTFAARLLPDLTGLAGKPSSIGRETTDTLLSTLRAAFPAEAFNVVKDQLAHLQKQDRVSYPILAFSLAVTLWLASSLYVAIIDALNRIMGVSDTRSIVKSRLIAIGMTALEAVVLIGSLLVIVLWPHILARMGMSEPAAYLATFVQWLAVFGLVLFSFALTYYVAPDADQRWEWITPGSLIGTIAFLIASFGFRVYVQNFANYDKSYGSLGGVMVLLFWFWISSLVLLTSAQLNKIIEDASPLGKNFGQKVDVTDKLDLKAIPPVAQSEVSPT